MTFILSYCIRRFLRAAPLSNRRRLEQSGAFSALVCTLSARRGGKGDAGDDCIKARCPAEQTTTTAAPKPGRQRFDGRREKIHKTDDGRRFYKQNNHRI